MAARIDEFGTPRGLQPLRGRLGARDGHAVPVDQAGRLALGRHAQRHDRALARTASRRRARSAHQFHHVIDVAPTVLEAAGPAGADVRQRRAAEADRGREHALRVRRRRAPPSATRRSTSRCSCNRGIYHKGWTAVTRHTHPVGARSRCRRSTTTSGSSTTRTPTGRQAHDLAAEMPEKLARAAAAVPRSRRASTTCCRSTTAGSSASTPTSPAGPTLIKGNSQLLFGGMGRLTENSVLNIKNKSHAVTAEIDGPRGRRRGRDHRPGRRVRRLEPLRQGRQAEVLLQPARPPAASTSRATRAMPAGHAPGAHGVRLRRRRPRQGRRRRALRRRRARSARAASRRTVPMIFSADETCDVGSRHGARRSATTTRPRAAASPAPSTGCRSTSTTPPRTSTT